MTNYKKNTQKDKKQLHFKQKNNNIQLWPQSTPEDLKQMKWCMP